MHLFKLRSNFTTIMIIQLLLSFMLNAEQKVSGNMEQLMRGAILLEIIDKNKVDGIRISFTIKADKRLIWKAIASYDLIEDIYPDYGTTKILESQEKKAIVTYYLNILFKKYTYTLIHNLEPEKYRTTWEMQSGDFKQIFGFWEIHDTPEAGVYLLTSESFVDTGFSLPTWMVNLVKKSESKAMAKSLRTWVNGHQDYLTKL